MAGYGPSGEQLVYAAGECEIDLTRRELRVRGSAVPVGGRAFEIIEVLARSAGEIVAKDELMDRIWPGAIVTENTLQVHAGAIRKALGPYRSLLKTEPGRGYRLLGSWSARRQDAAEPPVGLQRVALAGEPRATNLPATVTRLIGRSDAVARLRDLMSAYRVVTLTGPGGIGKTSLALRAARGVAGDFTDGAWLVELAPLSDPALVPTAIASVLQCNLNENSAAAVARAIGDRNVLLVLDNCEHLIDVVADVVETLVQSCPRTTILTTSREVLRIAGEHVYRVPPLDVPAQHEVSNTAAIELFIERVTSLDAEFSADSSMRLIATICRHLDGIPLAIEFAAARAVTLGVEQLAAHLDDRFQLLTQGRRTALPRHRTLRATLDWSYELLAEPERMLLGRLAIFAGAFSLEAVGAVVAGARTGSPEIVEVLTGLVAKSLVVAEANASVPRFHLLETTRAYALERLADSGERERLARRHAEHYREVIERAEAELRIRPANVWLADYGTQINNVRAALDWAFSAGGDLELGAALTAAAVPLWMHLSLLDECRLRAERALAATGTMAHRNARQEMKLHAAVGASLTYTTGDAPETDAAWTKALELAETLNEPEYQLRSLWGLWFLNTVRARYRDALALAQRFNGFAAGGSDSDNQLVGARMVGLSQHYLGDQTSARRHFERVFNEAVRHRSYTSRFPIDVFVVARVYLARVLWLQGFPDLAMRTAEISIGDARAADHAASLGYALALGPCAIALLTGNQAAAEYNVGVLCDHAKRFGLTHWHALGVCYQGVLAMQRGDSMVGSQLLRAGFDQFGDSRRAIRYVALLRTESLGHAGQLPEGLARFNEGIEHPEQTEEPWLIADLLRIRGERTLSLGTREAITAAEWHFRQAIDRARQQGALSLELRAATSLARLLCEAGRTAEAMALLQPVYDRFTEGFETADLKAAKAILQPQTSARNSPLP